MVNLSLSMFLSSSFLLWYDPVRPRIPTDQCNDMIRIRLVHDRPLYNLLRSDRRGPCPVHQFLRNVSFDPDLDGLLQHVDDFQCDDSDVPNSEVPIITDSENILFVLFQNDSFLFVLYSP